MNSLTFDEPTHTYRLDGRVVPSVTQILKRVYPDVYAGIPAHILGRKARLGTAVHKAIELELLGQLDWHSLHEEVVPYVESWMLWWHSTVDTLDATAIEQRLYSPAGYAMTRDFYGLINGESWLIDWKITSTVVPTHQIQIAGYNHGGPTQADVCGSLYLRSDGAKADFDRVVWLARLPDWLATLRVFNLQEKMK